MRTEKLMENIEGESASEECLSDVLLLGYFEGSLSENEITTVHRHLNACPICFQVMASLVKNSISTISDAEKAEVENLITLTPDKQAARIIASVDKFQSSSLPPSGKITKVVLTKPIITIHNLGFHKVGYAFVAVMLLSAATFWGARYFNTTYKIRQAERLLRDNYQIPIEENVRLSGGYAPTGASTPMAGNISDRLYLVRASELAEEAMANGSECAAAEQLLAQIGIIQGEYSRADSILGLVARRASDTAAVLNDLGVLHFKGKHWETAASYFEAAIRADPKFKEARYNLALTKSEMGATQDAISLLNEYIELEANAGWKCAALRYKRKLQQDEY
jgi:tetratricopeptide (TPR) repeat protein